MAGIAFSSRNLLDCAAQTKQFAVTPAMKISATIITLNEEENISDALASLAWADEVIVVDSGSTDQTCRIAEDAGAQVIRNDWPGFAQQKQFAAEQAQHDWIFSLDADERVSPELSNSITAVRNLSDTQRSDGYRIPRRSFYQGRWIKGGGWYPNRQLRLYRKSRGRWAERHIHESVRMDPDARVENLAGDILHYSVRDSAQHHRMIGERYAPLAALQMFEEGRRTSRLRIATAAPLGFIRSFILKGGFRDGMAGLTIARFAGHNDFLKHLMLWEKQKQSDK